jgi:hypothetical protein
MGKQSVGENMPTGKLSIDKHHRYGVAATRTVGEPVHLREGQVEKLGL